MEVAMSEIPGGDRLPPQSRDAERCVLGSMLRDNACIHEVVQVVREESFYFDAHQKIFKTILDIYDSGNPVDLIILADKLKLQKMIEDIGGYPYLAELWDFAPTAANAEYYARIVRDKGIIRSLIHASNEILRDAYDQAQPADDLLAKAEREVLDIAEKGVTGSTSTLQEALKDAYSRMDARKRGDHNDISGIPTGFVDLDELTAGFQKSELVILAARPSVGKTAMALNMVRHVVIEERIPVFFVSLEQAKIELAERLLVCQARVNSHHLRKGTLRSDEMQRILDAGGTLHKAKLFIDDLPSQTMLRISANARRLKLREDIRLVVIDYLQLIEPENRRDPRQEQVAQISRRLKYLARELEIPVVALAQVNRSSEDRQDHKPRLSDLRESGSLEQDADTVLLLHRPKQIEGGIEDNIIDVIVGKQRNGPTGEIQLAYLKEFMRYENKAIDTSFGIDS
jgi:replicative DNA helicase